jgi:predicted AlkP superfamily pyrophosphatase or phosphodiesterase
MIPLPAANPHRALRRHLLVALAALLPAAPHSALAAPVLMISIDGMKPEYVTQADAHGLRVPTLRGLMRDGVYATGVTGVWPTVTYPSHTTLVTGVAPAEHGIDSNTLFDPERAFDGAWYWYAQQVRVPTLWQAARAAGLGTASVGWPVTVGALGIDYLIPEYWRGGSPGATTGPSDRALIAALCRPDGLLDEMQQRLGPYMMGNETSVAGDEIKTTYAVDILRRHKPAFMTLHLSSLDQTEHETGPFSPQANATLEAIDAMVARLAAAAREADPSTAILVVSDHGFAQLTHHVNLTIPFLKAGLIQMSDDADSDSDDRSIVGWKAQLWLAGGMAAVMLHDPGDEQAAQQAGALLRKLAADPNNGIAAVLDRGEIKKRGGFPDAAFVVVFKLGYYAGTEETGDLVTPIDGPHGGHGFSPEFPEMRSSFFLAGPGIARHRDLGLIDMRQIAPTVAALLNVPLPTAKATPLPVKP